MCVLDGFFGVVFLSIGFDVRSRLVEVGSFVLEFCWGVMGKGVEGWFFGVFILCLGVMGFKVRFSLMLVKFMNCDIKKFCGEWKDSKICM